MKIALLPWSKGFTLVELMVVIAIISILSVIGIVVYTSQQKNARDARRRADIEAIAQALEGNRELNATSYTPLAASQFSSGIPADPGGNGSAVYCAASSVVSPTTWTNASVCPTVPAATFTALAAGNPGAVSAWTVCALLEGGASWFCRNSSQ